jgi:hypothetical protein
MEIGAFGLHQVPDGWVKASEWGKEGSPDEIITCGWKCLGDVVKRAMQHA